MINQEDIDRQVKILSEMKEYIEETISYADITDVYHEINAETQEVLCVLYISRGSSNFQVAFNWHGVIDAYSPKTPKMMLVDIHNAICGIYLKKVLEMLEKSNLSCEQE